MKVKTDRNDIPDPALLQCYATWAAQEVFDSCLLVGLDNIRLANATVETKVIGWLVFGCLVKF